MSKKERNDTEIDELLKQLKEQTASDAETASEKKEKKAKYVTDDDVKALLKKYYSDIETETEEKEPELQLDTSEFIAEEEVEEADTADQDITEENISEDKPTEEYTVIEDESEDVVNDETTDEATENAQEDEEDVLLAEIEEEERLTADMLDDGDMDAENLFSFDDGEENVTDVSDKNEIDNDPEFTTDDDIEDLFVNLDEEEEPETSFMDDILDDDGVDIDLPDDGIPQVTDKPENESEPCFEESEQKADDGILEKVTEENDEPEELTYEEGYATAPNVAEEINREEWTPTAYEAKIDDSELELMIALGFGDKLRTKYGNERVRNAEEKMRIRSDRSETETTSFGYRGREYTQKSDVKRIKSNFNRDRSLLILRLIGTILIAGFLFVLENVRLFGIVPTGVFNSSEDPTGHAVISMLLLAMCAAISYKNVINGILFAFGRSKSGNPVMPFVLIVFFIYNIIIAVASPNEGVVLYGFVAALGLLLDVFADIFDYNRTRMTFNVLNDRKDEDLYGLCDLHKDSDGTVTATSTKIAFAEGFFKNINVKYEKARLLIIMIPLAAVGAITVIAVAISGAGLARSLSAFPAVFAFAAPIGVIFGNSWHKLCASIFVSGKNAGLIGELSDEQANIDFAVFDDQTVFPSDKAKIRNIRFFNNAEIYNTLYNVNALFQGVGGPLCDIMKYSASNLGTPKSVEMISASGHFVEARVDGKNTVCAGSFAALSKRGISILRDPQDSKDGETATVMYAAVNGEVSARFCIEYGIDAEFKRESSRLASEGMGVRIKTLDPNIDKALLVSLFGEDMPVSVERAPKNEENGKKGFVTSVFARGKAKNLITPLVVGRRIKRVEKSMNTAVIAEMSVGVFLSVLLLLLGVDGAIMPSAATAVQLLMLIPAVMIYLLGINSSSGKR